MQIKNTSLLRGYIKPLLMVLCAFGALFAGAAFAVGGVTAVSLSTIATNVDTSVTELAGVLSDISLIAGVGFVMASFFKFHQHKLNPTQVPISQGVTLLLIGAGLMLFPTMLPTAKRALFGSQAQIAKVGGGQIKGIIGSGT